MAKKLNNIKSLKGIRKDLRNNPTKAESMLWKALQKKQLDVRKLRRQHSLENYIVDFYCPTEKLVVEVDGQVHYNSINQAYDAERTQKLNAFGIKVVRFENKLVFEQMDMVLDAIKQEFKK